MLPIHFNYNFIERDSIPLHNEKYSRLNDEYSKQTEIIRKGFIDNSLPAPSHVILNHINSWETMQPIQQEADEKKSPQTGLTSISMSQRLNKNKFLTIIYYKPSLNKY